MKSHWKLWILCLIGLFLVTSPTVRGEESETTDEDDDDYADDERVSDGLPPIITTMPQKFPQKEGSEFQLDCAGEHFEDYGVIWSHGSKILAAGGVKISRDARVHLFENDTLRIEQAAMTDSGIYTCTLWPNVTLDHIVFIVSADEEAGKPHVLVPNSVIVVNQTEPVSLTCHSIGSPSPIVSWIRQGDKAFPTGEKVIQGSTITFSSVSRHHGGKYDCFASNSVGNATTALQLEVNFAPEIEVERDSLHSAGGSEVDLICTVHAEPKPRSVKWFFNGKEIDPKDTQHGIAEHMHHKFSLHIKNVGEKDYGDYVCEAENKLGHSTGLIQLTGKPSQPVLIDNSAGDEHMSYRLVWKMESSIPIEDYKLSYRKGDDEWQNSSVKGEPHPNQEYVYLVTHILRKLVSNSDYEVVLFAMNKNGWSQPARTHKFHINGKNYQSLNYEGETAKASVVSKDGASSNVLSTSTFASLLVLFAITFWRRQ